VREYSHKRTYDELSKHSRFEGDGKGLRKENEKLKKLLSEYTHKVENYDSLHESMVELQERIVEFETRINQLLDGADQPASKQSGQNSSLRHIVRELNARVSKFRQQN
jgi:polyhydroxyalkanoate synthesis regulator phasin